ncbi:RtcB family protein [Sphingomonas sp. LaA6.9]|uniref:RtcB family protein n=1 Tax=Sphingomonas sp. LaA6.9 TaxID=2919914 RepID=UPI0032AF4C9A
MEAVNCHHNYVTRENHFGANVLVTRKGAVRAAMGVMGIIPRSVGAQADLVEIVHTLKQLVCVKGEEPFRTPQGISRS